MRGGERPSGGAAVVGDGMTRRGNDRRNGSKGKRRDEKKRRKRGKDGVPRGSPALQGPSFVRNEAPLRVALPSSLMSPCRRGQRLVESFVPRSVRHTSPRHSSLWSFARDSSSSLHPLSGSSSVRFGSDGIAIGAKRSVVLRWSRW